MSEEIVKEKLIESDFDPTKPTITLCNSGIQAAFLATVIDNFFPDTNIRLFNVSDLMAFGFLSVVWTNLKF